MKKTELLIPVGNKECLIAAIHNGADAVYLGGKKFGARAYSNNFDNEEMIEAIKLCHLYNVKIYVTVNTMIYNEEIEEVLEYLKFLYRNNVDAVIMQDNGLIEITRKLIPNLEIHVSTQAHNHNEPAINHYKEIGCTRVVFDRESSLETINNIKTDIEKEVFVYGALCISYSGNCLFSALNGQRSANRGMCVGSCRLPYKLYKNNTLEKEGFILSTKDLNTLPNITKILDSNIDSLKIEGRMKSKEYVIAVTQTFRRLIDAYYNNKECVLKKEEEQKLLKTYNRSFTNGYLFNETNIINGLSSNHQGVEIGKIIDVNNKRITIELTDDIHQEDAIRFEKTNQGMYLNTLYDKKGLLTNKVSKGNICQIDNKFRIMRNVLLNTKILKTIDTELNKELNNYQEKKNNIKMSFKANLNTNTTLTINYKDKKITCKGTTPQEAISAPITKEKIQEQLLKLGGTPFICNDITIEIENNLFINIKELNNLRREAIELLLKELEEETKPNFLVNLHKYPKHTERSPKISILTRNEDQLNIAIRNNIDYIYITDENIYNKYKDKHKNLYLRLNRVIENHKEYQNENLLCTEFGSIIKYKDNNKIKTDYYLNAANDYTIKKYKDLNANSITLSVELDKEQLNNINNKNDSEIIVYGTPECMIIKNNIFNIKDEKTYIEDINKQKYKVTFDTHTHIFNHKKINYLDKLDKLKGFGIYRIELLDESMSETQKIINQLKNNL